MLGGRIAIAFAVVIAAAGTARGDRALARALVEEGAQFEREGEKDSALERYEQAIEQDADYLPSYDRAAWLWMAAGRYDIAIAKLERVTLRHPDYGFGWYALGFAYRKTGQFSLAVMCYETYVSLHPEEADPYYGLALAHKGAGSTEQASVALQRYLTLESRPERAAFMERARIELEALGVEPPPISATATGDRLGRARELIRDQRFASAQVLLSNVGTQTSHQRAVLWQLRAQAYLGSGNAEPAIAASLIALAADPTERVAYQTLVDSLEAIGATAIAEYFQTLTPP